MTLKLKVHEDLKWASVVAQRWIDFVDGRPAARLCLPTGETPRPIYAISSPEIDLSSATVFLLKRFNHYRKRVRERSVEVEYERSERLRSLRHAH